MFMRTKTHDLFVAALTQAFEGLVRKQGSEIKQLRAQLRETEFARDLLDERVQELETKVAVRGQRGRFVKREQVAA